MGEVKTVHQLTGEFNELVVHAHTRGLAMWATHHRSDFSSRRVAEEQLAKLRSAMGGSPATIIPQVSPATIIPLTSTEGLRSGVSVGGLPVSGKRVLEVTLDLPPDDLIIVGPSVDWAATATLPDGTTVTHLSRASTWMIAMMLAVAHWRKTKAISPTAEVTIAMEKK
jgi:hypothetical protein